MNSIKDEKIKNMKERTRLEQIILNLEKTKDPTVRKEIDELKKIIFKLKSKVPNDDHKLYLSDIIKLEQPEFGSNNLILSPVGSGKSTLIEEYLVKEQTGKVLLLVSNRFLKESTCPNDNAVRKYMADKGQSKLMFTTKNNTKYGKGKYEIHVMTYQEFGNRIQNNNDFVKDIKQIYCDEVHSLIEYRDFKNSRALTHAIKYLFDKHENKQIFYFTATQENIDDLERKQPGALKYVKKFNYLNHPNIKQYITLSEYTINNIEQIRPHLNARLKSFNYFGYKGLAFNRTIAGMKAIEKIALEEGFKPLLLWSDANESHKLTEDQLIARQEIIMTNKIPEPYNFLIINSSMREGWDLKDEKVKLAIMNTTNTTDFIQARGRIRNDIDVLIYRTSDKSAIDIIIEVPDKYMNTPLSVLDKDNLCKYLNIVDSKGRLTKWRTVMKTLEENGYVLSNKRMRKEGKQITLTTITR